MLVGLVGRLRTGCWQLVGVCEAGRGHGSGLKGWVLGGTYSARAGRFSMTCDTGTLEDNNRNVSAYHLLPPDALPSHPGGRGWVEIISNIFLPVDK